MSNEHVAYLVKHETRFELVYPAYNLALRGPYAEWLFQAAAEVIRRIDSIKAEGALDELEMLAGFGDMEDAPVQMDSLRYESGTRFETVPQCLVTVGDTDYRWVAPEARNPGVNGFGERIHDMLLTRGPARDAAE